MLVRLILFVILAIFITAWIYTGFFILFNLGNLFRFIKSTRYKYLKTRFDFNKISPEHKLTLGVICDTAPEYNKFIKKALRDYNKSNLVKFYLTDDWRKANIRFVADRGQDVLLINSTQCVLGETYCDYIDNANNYQRRSMQVIELHNAALKDLDNASVLCTVEHELGHALGLDHRNGNTCMRAQNNGKRVTRSDFRAIKRLYK